jgi:hypothetical protein
MIKNLIAFTLFLITGAAIAGNVQSQGQKAKLKMGSISNDDYPPAALRNLESGTSTALFNISASGVVTDCIAFGATPRLDDHTCALIKRRFSYRTAQDRKGRAIAETKTQRVTWRIPSGQGDLAFDRTSKTMKYAELKLNIDRKGKVTQCKVNRSSGDRLWDIKKCTTLKVRGLFPIFDPSGKAVKSEKIFSVPRAVPDAILPDAVI